jgi:hypothetical protein
MRFFVYPTLLELLNHGHVIPGDLPHKLHIRVEQHDVKMLHGMYRFQRSPVLEPYHLDAKKNKEHY